MITTLSTTETTPTITNVNAIANPENNEIKTAQDHRELLFEKLKKMDEESCVDPLLVKMLRETTSEPETTGKVHSKAVEGLGTQSMKWHISS